MTYQMQICSTIFTCMYHTLATVLTCLHGSLSQVYPDHVSLVRGVQLVPAVVAALLPRTRLPA